MAKERHYTREQLEELKVGQLEQLATKRELTVTRGDGEDGDPRKADYVDALAGSYGAAPDGNIEHDTGAPAIITSKSREKGPDETVPGGRYVVNGRTVNAHGQPLDAHGAVIERE